MAFALNTAFTKFPTVYLHSPTEEEYYTANESLYEEDAKEITTTSTHSVNSSNNELSDAASVASINESFAAARAAFLEVYATHKTTCKQQGFNVAMVEGHAKTIGDMFNRQILQDPATSTCTPVTECENSKKRVDQTFGRLSSNWGGEV